jgi:hypothetical protein
MASLSEEEDRPIGRPRQIPRPEFSPPVTVEESQTVAPGGDVLVDAEPRAGEGLGRPTQPPKEMRSITDSDRGILVEQQKRAEEAEKQRIDDLLNSEAALLRLPAYLGHPLIVAFFVGMAALVGLFVVSHITSTLAAMETFAPGFRYAGYAALSLLALCALYAMARFAWLYVRFRVNRPVGHRGLRELAHRTKMRWLVQQKKQEGCDHLSEYLRGFPLGSKAERKALIGLGLTEEKLTLLEEVRSLLLDQNRFGNPDAWLLQFQSRFQSVLDEAAYARIAYFSRRVALMTAISPNTLVDVLLTFYCSFTMMADLCRIYQLRVGPWSTLALLGHIFFNAYIAGQLNEFEEIAEAGMESFWPEIAARLGVSTALGTLGKLGIKAGARSGSGLLNYYLLRRVGRSAARALQPMPPG